MRYRLKQRWLSWGDDFAITDEDGNPVLEVDGRVLALGDQLTILTPDGVPVVEVSQKLLAWGPTYEIVRNDEVAAVVKKALFTLFSCRFSVDVPGPDDREAAGDFLDHEYEFTRHGENVAVVSKRWFSWTDDYAIDVADAEDDLLILASAVVIDLCCHEKR